MLQHPIRPTDDLFCTSSIDILVFKKVRIQLISYLRTDQTSSYYICNCKNFSLTTVRETSPADAGFPELKLQVFLAEKQPTLTTTEKRVIFKTLDRHLAENRTTRSEIRN